MRVLVNLFDREPIKNVLSATIFTPEIAIFLCDKMDSNLFKESAVYRFFRRRGLRTKPRFFYFDARDPAAVRKTLIAVVRDYPGCVFDFTGGRDLMLVLAGMISSDLDLPAFYIDIRRGRFRPLRHCEKLENRFQMPLLSAEDLLAVTGAAIHGYGNIAPSQTNGNGFEQDVLTVFGMQMKNTKTWGEFVNYLQVCCSGTGADQLEVSGAKTMRGDKNLVQNNPVLMESLLEKGLLTSYHLEGKGVFFTFKNALIKRCLLSVGVWLELYCFVVVREAGFFSEVLSSVIIDWDSAEDSTDTAKNEVDLLLVKGVIPTFISCKMGVPSPLTLCEVKQLAVKFAGNYGRSVVVSAQKLGKEAAALRNRAEELGVLLLDRDSIDKGTLANQLISSVSGAAPEPPRPPLPFPKDWKVWK